MDYVYILLQEYSGINIVGEPNSVPVKDHNYKGRAMNHDRGVSGERRESQCHTSIVFT